MKRCFLFAIFLLLLLVGRQASAQTAYGISEIAYDPESDSVAGYSATELDYTACYYYDAYVVGTLYQGNQLADSGASLGICSAEVFTDHVASPGTWTVLSDHYVVPVDYEPDYGYYDPFGYDLFGGEYGSGYSFYGCYYCGGYSWEELLYLGSTEVSIAVPPPCLKEPTLTASPATVTRAGTVTFTLGNLCPPGQRTIQSWKFTDTGGTTVQRGASDSTTWSGVLVTSGSVSVTVIQGGNTYARAASVTVNNRTSGFAFTAVQPQEVQLPFDCSGTQLTVPSPPIPEAEVAKYCLLEPFSWTSVRVSDNGPNQGYRYTQSASNSSPIGSTTYRYGISPDLKDTFGEFYREQCGDYDQFPTTGFTSGAHLLADATSHESSATNSHYQQYVDAQNDPAKNLGVGLEAIVGLPPGDKTAFDAKADAEGGRRRDAIVAATGVEPCGTALPNEACKPGAVRGPRCECHGWVNYNRKADNTPKPYVPCRPSGLSAVAASSNKVNLSWMDNSFNEQGFAINRRTAGGTDFQIGTVGENQTAYSDTTVAPSTDYTYSVQAYIVDVYSYRSNEASVHTPAPVSLSPSSLTFGEQTVGSTSTTAQTATLTNPTGNPPLAIASVTASGDFARTNGCGPSLAAGSSCTIGVTFTPTATGLRPGTLRVDDSAPGSPHQATLSGTGKAAVPKVGLSTASLVFAGQSTGTTSVAQAITVTNTGTANLAITSITPSGDFILSNSCSGSLAVNASCTVNVTFAPTAVGVRTGTLTFVDSAADSPQTVALSGTGTIITLAPAGLTFAGQVVGTASAAQTVTLTNSSLSPFAINSIVPSGDFSTTSNCPASLAVNASCTINVSFVPITAGARAGSLSIGSDQPTTPTAVTLSGTGLPLIPSLSALSPSLVTAGSSGFTMVVTGSNFNRNAVVRVNGSDRPTTYVNAPQLGLPLQLRAALSAADLAATGTLSITAVNPGGGGGESTALQLTVTTTPIPLIGSLSPARVRAGGAAATLTVNGSNFPLSAVVMVNGTSHTPTWISSSQLTLTLSSAEIAASGVLAVSITSLSSGSNSAPFVVFRYGDVNFDNTVNVSDLAALSKYLAGNLTPFDATPADLDCDGTVNLSDYMTLANYLAGNVTSLPVGTGCP